MDSSKAKVKSLYKALKLLEYFDEDHKEVGVTELAESSGLPKSSVHNILQTFEQCGYVTQNYDNQKYMLGGAAVSLFSRYKLTNNLDYRITEYLQQLRNRYKNNIYLAEKEGDMAVYIYAEQAFSEDNHLSKVGAKVPLHCTGVGKILLGYSTVNEKNEYYKGKLEKDIEITEADIDNLKKEMDEIIYKGYAFNEDEYKEKGYSVAVPIINGTEAVRFAIGLVSQEPISDYMLKNYLGDLKDVAKKIAGIIVKK